MTTEDSAARPRPRARARSAPVVEIGLRDVYDQVLATKEAVTSLTLTSAGQAEHVAGLELRVTRLERLVWLASGAALGGGGLVGGVVGHLLG